MKKTTIIILFCASIVLGMIAGIIFGILDDKKLEEAQINEIRKVNELIESNRLLNQSIQNDVVATNQSNVKLSPNATICFEKHYKECGHTIIEKETIEDNEVNKDEEYFKSKIHIEMTTSSMGRMKADIPVSFARFCGLQALNHLQ